MANQCRQSVYFNAELLAELRAEAKRQNRSISWLVQRAWKLHKEQLKKLGNAVEAGKLPPAIESSFGRIEKMRSSGDDPEDRE